MPANPNPFGADLQNISNQFHFLQDLQITASVVSKAIAGLKKFETAAADPEAKGKCTCNPTTTCSTPPAVLQKDKITLEACKTFCDPAGNGSPDHSVCSAGYLLWAGDDIYKQVDGAADKYGLKWLKLVDKVPASLKDGKFVKPLAAVGVELQNINDLLTKIQCYIDLFSEGFHIGSYSDQRPDLHMCVPYAGHGVYASLADSANGRWGIGARYTSYNLSQVKRAQMRTGGFAVTAFGKTLSILPGTEFNIQLDGYEWFDRNKPLGIAALGQLQGGGLSLTKSWGIFHLLNKAQVSSLDSNANGIVSRQELLVATYSPFGYSPGAPFPDATWPRPGAIGVDPWEGKSAAVYSVGVNIAPSIKPIKKNTPTITIYPGVTITPYFKLAAGADWFHEDYRLRGRLLDSLNKNLATKLQIADFDRPMHPFQAPDVTDDDGTRVSVKPEVGAELAVGIKLSNWATVGVQATIGFSVDMKPGGSGGVIDLNRAFEQALINSNPPPTGECKPTWSFKDTQYCSNKNLPESTTTYACSALDVHNSCCLKYRPGTAQAFTVCIDGWTGVTQASCKAKDLNSIGKAIPGKKLETLKNDLAGITATWSPNKSCTECAADGTCANPEKLLDLPSFSQCESRGYCCTSSGVTTFAGKVGSTGSTDGPGVSARFGRPVSPVVESGDLYVADGTKIRKISVDTGIVTTLAGSDVIGNVDNGSGAAARFSDIRALTGDGMGQLYVADGGNQSIRKVDTATGATTTLIGWAVQFGPPTGIAYANGKLYVSAGDTHVIRRLDTASSASSVVAGTVGAAGFTDGISSAARFGNNNALVYDGVGAVYVADGDNYAVRRLDLASFRVTTVAGGTSGFQDGVGSAAKFNYLQAVGPASFDTLYVPDGSRIRKIDLLTSTVSTYSGSGTQAAVDGAINVARYGWVNGMVAASMTTSFVTDLNTIRRISTDCDPTKPNAITYDVSAASCAGEFRSYRCMTETQPTATGWTGPGCHPLHSGFPSACSCNSNLDCAAAETCDLTARVCKRNGVAPVCACTGTGNSCGNGAARSCIDGACTRTCVYNPATADTVCGAILQCSPTGSCVPRASIPFAEQVVSAVKNPPPSQPRHAIGTYAMSEFELIAALNAGINIGLKLKLFKKEREFSLWKWADAWDLGSIEKAWFQPGLDTSYDWDTTPNMGTVKNYQPNLVTRYNATNTSGDNPDELIAWCKATEPYDAQNPQVPPDDAFGTSLVDTVNFGTDIGQQVSDTQNLCINGTPMIDFLRDPKKLNSSFINGTCTFAGTVVAGRGPLSFPCKDVHLNLLRLWGCLATNLNSNATSVRSIFPAAIVNSTSPATFNPLLMMKDPTGTFDVSNINSGAPVVSAWMRDVEACFDSNYTDTIDCKCPTGANSECNSSPGQTCVANTCKKADGTVPQCPVVKTGGVNVVKCCGDGVRESNEDCDDGNPKSGDGCSSLCQVENTGSCCLPTGCAMLNRTMTPAVCRASGGNPVPKYTCTELKQCGVETIGACYNGGACVSPAYKSQCILSGDTFVAGGICPSCAARPDDMKLWYPLDEKSGSMAMDLAMGIGAWYRGAPVPTSGRVGGGLKFDGTHVPQDELVVGTDSESNVNLGDFSLAAWVSTTKPTGTIVSNRDFDSGQARGYVWDIYGNGMLLQMADDISGWYNYITPAGSTPNLADGAFHFLSVTVSRAQPDGGKMYVDGNLVYTFNPTNRKGSLFAASASFTMGSGPQSEPLTGTLDEVMMFRRVLAPFEIAALYRADSLGVCR